MEILKRQIKRITSIILIITILVGVLPNFGLLKESMAANTSEFQSGVILRLNEEKGIWTDGESRAISLDIIVKDIEFTSFVLPIKFDQNKLTPAYTYSRRGKEYIEPAERVADFASDINAELPNFTATYLVSDTDWSNVDNGKIVLDFKDSKGVTLNCEGEKLICTISFIVKDASIININQFDTSLINIDKFSNLFKIYHFESDKYYTDINTYFSLQGVNILPTVQSLDIKTNPTEGQEYEHGSAIDLIGGELTATYTDGSTTDISMLDENVTVKMGEKEVEDKTNIIADVNNTKLIFEYEECTIDLDITVSDPLDRIEFYDRDGKIKEVNQDTGFNNGESIEDNVSLDEIFIKTFTKSGKEDRIPISNEEVSIEDVDIDKARDKQQVPELNYKWVGIQYIKVTYKGKETSFPILVNDKVSKIEISTENPPKDELQAGSEFTKTGAIKVFGSFGEIGEILMSSDNVTVTELDGSAVDLRNIPENGQKKLLVSYAGFTAEYEVNIIDEVVSIVVNGRAETKYKENLKQSDFEGITVTEKKASGKDGQTLPLNIDWIDTSAYKNDIADLQELPVNYPYKDTTIQGIVKVQVKDELIGITIDNFKTDYVYGNELDYTDAKFSAQYVSGIIGPIEFGEGDLEVSEFDSTTIGEKELTFTYDDGDNTASTTITVNVDKDTLKAPECEQLEIVAGLKLSTIADQLPKTDYGSIVWKNEEQTLTYVEGEENVQEIDATYKMNDTYSPYYNDVDCKIKVKVLKREVESIKILDTSTNKTNYVEGQTFNPIGMQIEVTYNDRGIATITVDESTKGFIYSPDRALTTDDVSITVTHEGHEDTQAITVVAKVVESIKVTTEPTKTSYVEGQALDLDGMIVTANYNDGDKQVTTDYITSPANGDILALTDTQITITYNGTDAVADIATTTTPITVKAKVVESIKVTTEPTKTSYVEGQALDLDGMIVTANYNDGDKQVTTDYITSPANGDTLALTDTQITITYTGTDAVADIATTTTPITVKAKVVESIKVTTPPTKTSYVEGQALDLDGMIVTANYNDGDKQVTTDYTASPANGDTLALTDTQITVTYTGTDIADGANAPTAEQAITVNARVIESIAITKAPDTVNYFERQDFDPKGMEITVTYNDHERPLVISSDYATKGITFTPSTSLVAGTTGVEVDLRGYKATQAITVAKDYVTSITVSHPNNSQQVEKDVNLTNTTIQKVWASGLSHEADDTEAVTIDMISSDNITNGKFTKPGNVEITVTYNNNMTGIANPTATFTVNVEDAIQSITLSEKEAKTYWVGDDIASNLKLEINYSNSDNNKTIDSTSPDWSKCVINDINMSKPGTHTLTVTYGEITSNEISIKVKDFVQKIKVVNNKLIYKLNEDGSFKIQVNKYMASEPEEAIAAIKDEYSLSIPKVNTTSVQDKTNVTVSYKNEKNENLTATFDVQVINATAKAILETTPTTMPEKWGDTLDLTGASIKVQKQDGSSETITLPNNAIIVSEYNPKTLAEQTITFTYKYKELNEMNEEVTKTMPVEGVLNITLQNYWIGAIEVNGIPTTTIKGQELNLSNATVSKIMATGPSSEKTSILRPMIKGFDKNTEGKQTITITNWGKSATFDVTVTDYITGISMNKLPNKTEYTQGESLDVTGAVLNVAKQSGIKEVAVTKEMISGYNPEKAGQQVITVSYGGFTTSFIVNVKAKTTDKPNKPVTPNKPNKPVNPTRPNKPNTEQKETYTVTFIDYDGTVLKTEEVERGQGATAPKVEKRAGYKFLGWNTSFDEVEQNLIVTAKYMKIVRAEVKAPNNMKIEKGNDIDLSEVTMIIRDEDGNDKDEIQVTKNMISGFDSEKVGAQIITVKYTDEEGFEYTNTFRIRVERPAQTLGQKDEVKEESNIKDTLIPATIGLGVTSLLLILIAAITRKNVQIYAVFEDSKKLIGKEKISKNNKAINLDVYTKQLENAIAVELRIDDKTVEKLDGEILEVAINSKTKKYKMTDTIVIKK